MFKLGKGALLYMAVILHGGTELSKQSRNRFQLSPSPGLGFLVQSTTYTAVMEALVPSPPVGRTGECRHSAAGGFPQYMVCMIPISPLGIWAQNNVKGAALYYTIITEMSCRII